MLSGPRGVHGVGWGAWGEAYSGGGKSTVTVRLVPSASQTWGSWCIQGTMHEFFFEKL